MPTIDVQVHVYERNHPGRPWHAVLHGPSEVTGDQMVAAMDEVGVDGAILVSPYTQYHYDASYALEVRSKHPGRFAVVKPVDPTDPKVGETIADWKKTPGTVGIRIMMAAGPLVAPDDPGVNRVLAAAAQHALPVNVLSWGRVEQLGPPAARNPNTRIVVDHMGMLQPFELAETRRAAGRPAHAAGAGSARQCRGQDQRRWHARQAAVPSTRTSGTRCAASSSAFGIDRCMWGTDWTRAVAFLTYKEGVEAFRVTDRLTDSERAHADGRHAAEGLWLVACKAVMQVRLVSLLGTARS